MNYEMIIAGWLVYGCITLFTVAMANRNMDMTKQDAFLCILWPFVVIGAPFVLFFAMSIIILFWPVSVYLIYKDSRNELL